MQESKSCALPLGDTPTMSIYVAGVVGFEPTDVGVRVQCLTAWRHPTAKAEILWGDRRESNPWPPEPQSGVLPIELRPPYGAPRRIRTFDLCLRRALLYPAELWKQMEQVKGIGPSQPAWKASVLPLNYTCTWHSLAQWKKIVKKNRKKYQLSLQTILLNVNFIINCFVFI